MKLSRKLVVRLGLGLVFVLSLLFIERRATPPASTSTLEVARKPVDVAALKSAPYPWQAKFNSPECLELRSTPPGSKAMGTMGVGPRAKCFLSEADSRDHKREVEPSFDISLAHRVIYLPVMKAGTQMFQEVFRTRLRGRRIVTEKALLEHLAKHNMKLDQFFVFSFVREPFRMFVSSYEEVNKYVMNNRTRTRGFADMPITEEPARARQCLANIQHGQFTGLIPAHMYTQVWKLNRCRVRVDFVGKLESVDEDWRTIESKLGLEHKPLPVIHAAGGAGWVKRAKTDPPTITSKQLLGRYEADPRPAFKQLTREVCEYYKSDFECFGYDRSPCL